LLQNVAFDFTLLSLSLHLQDLMFDHQITKSSKPSESVKASKLSTSPVVSTLSPIDAAHFNPTEECLTFEETPAGGGVSFNVNDFHKVHLTGAVVIRHYRKTKPAECVARIDDQDYLHTIFKHYLQRLSLTGHESGDVAAKDATKSTASSPNRINNESGSDLTSMRSSSLSGLPPRTRTAFIAQFQAKYAKKSRVDGRWTVNFVNHPTFGVSYEIETIEQKEQKEQKSSASSNLVMINFREIKQSSFLAHSSVLNSWSRPVCDELERGCVVLDRVSRGKRIL